jgi:hypothetical protein
MASETAWGAAFGNEAGPEQGGDEVKAVSPRGRARAWSYSTLKDYESCPHRIKLKLEKAPVPEQTEENRGTIIHRLCEEFVKGEIEEVPRELRKFEEQFWEDRDSFFEGKMEVEQEWGFTQDWEQCNWFEAWLRVKCDQVLHLAEHELRITDHKSGKKFGNEVPHLQQAQLYALSAFMRYPKVEAIETEMRYLDEGKRTLKLWSRDKDCVRLLAQYNKRVGFFQVDTILKPNANRMNCKYCRYGVTNGSSACAHAVPWE